MRAQKKYDPGVSDKEIKLGHTNPYSGPLSAYGVIGKGITGYWNMVNDQGGVNGRKINFITYDDGFQPPKTVEMVRKLVEDDQVFAIYQLLGTPTNTGGAEVPVPEEGAAALRRHRRVEMGHAQGIPVDHGLAARLRD